MAYFMGIDIGSVASKGIVTGGGKSDIYHIIPSGSNYRTAAEKLKEELLIKSGLKPGDITFTAITGHGTDTIPFGDKSIADLRCCARGINRLFPGVRTVIDIRGQSSQVIRVGGEGRVKYYDYHDDCLRHYPTSCRLRRRRFYKRG